MLGTTVYVCFPSDDIDFYIKYAFENLKCTSPRTCFYKYVTHEVIKCNSSIPNTDKILNVLLSAGVWVGVEAAVTINP